MPDDEFSDGLGWQSAGHPHQRMRWSKRYEQSDQLFMPAVVEIEVENDSESPTLHLRFEVRNGRPEVTSVTVTAKAEGPEVSHQHLRGVDLRGFIEAAVGVLSLRLTTGPDGFPVVEGAVDSAKIKQTSLVSLARSIEAARSGSSPRSLTVDKLTDVARIYRANLSSAPTKAVGRAFGVGPRAASGYVQRARAAGLLPHTSPGKKQA